MNAQLEAGKFLLVPSCLPACQPASNKVDPRLTYVNDNSGMTGDVAKTVGDERLADLESPLTGFTKRKLKRWALGYEQLAEGQFVRRARRHL